jgi:hypothetical protein
MINSSEHCCQTHLHLHAGRWRLTTLLSKKKKHDWRLTFSALGPLICASKHPLSTLARRIHHRPAASCNHLSRHNSVIHKDWMTTICKLAIQCRKASDIICYNQHFEYTGDQTWSNGVSGVRYSECSDKRIELVLVRKLLEKTVEEWPARLMEHHHSNLCEIVGQHACTTVSLVLFSSHRTRNNVRIQPTQKFGT